MTERDETPTRWDVIEGLATLVDRSLVVAGNEDPPRYRLLETMRAYALEQLAQGAAGIDAGAEEDAVRRRHALAVMAQFARHTLGDATTLARCLAEMENARGAIAWASRHELALAAELSIEVTRLTTFTLWRHESGNWLLALETQMEQPAGRALPAALQARWWTERARIAAIRRDAHARIPARRAVALWRPLQQPSELLRATLTWVRSIPVPDAELDQACGELEALLPQIADLSLRERMGVQGALVRAANIRGDHAAVLAGREAELSLARQLGDRDVADVAESSIVLMLNLLGRPAEAVERGRALLARLETDESGRSGNLPWGFAGLIGALLSLGRADEARALLPRGLAACRQFASPALLLEMIGMAMIDGRLEDAAVLIGHARASYESHGIEFERQEKAQLAALSSRLEQALGASAFDALMLRGRGIDEGHAERLSVGVASQAEDPMPDGVYGLKP